MSLFLLAWKNILGNAFRSLAIFVCAALVAGLALTATIVVRGAEASLRLNLQKLGADLLVLPWGTITEKIEGMRLMSAAVHGWMPPTTMHQIADLNGVAKVSPQLFLANLEDSPHSPYPDLSLVAFDPDTDFTLGAWLEDHSATGLADGEAIAGTHFSLPQDGNELTLYGTPLKIVDRLAATETNIDETLFISFETAERMIVWSQAQEDGALNVIPGSITAVMVRLDLGSDPREIAMQILEEVHGVVPLVTPNMFQVERLQMIGVLRTVLGLLGGIWVLTLVFMGLVFSIAVNERRFEIGVLRALGFTSNWILKTLLVEGAALAVLGGFTGVLLAMLGVALFGDRVVQIAGLPLYTPSSFEMISYTLAGQILALISVTLAAFIPFWRISQNEVALTMKA